MKASRILIFLAIVSLMSCFMACKGSCQGSKSDKDSTKIDTLWNDSVQHVFFDTPFGASRDEVIRNFAKHGFTLKRDISTDTRLSFDYDKSKYYTFGGMSWELLNVYLTNGKFSSIQFYTPKTDKADAISDYNSIVNTVSQKYNLTDIEPKDTIVYGNKVAFSKSDCEAWITCYRYESIGNEIFYTVELVYVDTELDNAVSDEL